MFILKLNNNFLSTKKEYLSTGKYLPHIRHDSFGLLNLSFINNHLLDASLLFNFSFKVKYLLLIIQILFRNKVFIKKDGQFISLLKEKLNLTNVSSTIIPSSNNKKDIIFISSNNRRIIIKISNDKLHNNLIKNEYKNISQNLIYDSLFKKPEILFKGYFNNKFYIAFEFFNFKKYRVDDVLNLYEKSFSMHEDKLPNKKLNKHPFVNLLDKNLERLNLLKYKKVLNEISSSSTYKYFIVNNHGDFIYENILNTGKNYYLIDHEYFIKNGLEGLDIIKFFFHYYYFKKKLPFFIVFFLIQKRVGKEYFPVILIYFLSRLTERLKLESEVKKEIGFIEYLIKYYEKNYK